MKRLIVVCTAALLAGGAFNYLRPGALAYVGSKVFQTTNNSQSGDMQDPPTGGQPQQGAGFGGRQGRGGAPAQGIQPYDTVITKDAKTEAGVFTVHHIKDKVYFEIPKNEYDKDFLWASQIAKTTVGVGYGGQFIGSKVVRWDRHGDDILLKSVSYSIVADPKLPIAKAVDKANNDTVIMAFPIAALGKEDAAVIDVTRLYSTEVPEFSARARLRARGFDPTRTFIERVTPFPQNIEVEVTQTYTSPVDAPAAGGGAPTPAPGGGFGGGGMAPGSATILMHFSMVKLPEQPMQPRLFDDRVGYFSVSTEDFGLDVHKAERRTFITRWRLEKKDPNAAVSEPVKPIVYYVDPATPAKWAPWIKKGVEDWNEAFLEAGFKNAIIAKYAPTPQEDPTWSTEDVRNSVVFWLPSTTENAVGPHISDPRTGEILNADIQFYHNVMNLARDWYFTQVGPLDPRAQKFPLPDDLMGRLIEYVVCHEVGHTLGFQHNMKASALYPADKIRDKDWVHKMGHTPTLMDYSRFNYVAQPEDHIDLADLVPRIGPYDRWATAWGYKPIPNATSSDEEKKTLDTWAREQDKTPWYRFSTLATRGSDPGENTEAVGDADAVKSTAMGLKNLERVSNLLLTATVREGEPYDDLDEVYGRMLGQWSTELNHVAVIVGGFDSQEKLGGQDGVVFTPVSRDRQQAAVQFLNDHAFATPTWAIKPEILRRIEAYGVVDRVRTAQQRILGSLMNNQRFDRLVEQEAIDGDKAYRPSDFLADVRHGIFKELTSSQVVVDTYRRNLQDSYLELMNDKLNGQTPVTGDERALIREELRSLNSDIAAALPKAGNVEAKAHLEDLQDQIAKALDPKFERAPRAAAAGPGQQQGRRRGIDDGTVWEYDFFNNIDPTECWPDFAIRVHRN